MNDIRKIVDEVTKQLVDEGKLIEAGWKGLQLTVLPPDASPIQLQEMRKAFFAGAQHLFASIMSFLEEGQEPTNKDLDRMTLIHKELEEFVKELKQQTFD